MVNTLTVDRLGRLEQLLSDLHGYPSQDNRISWLIDQVGDQISAHRGMSDLIDELNPNRRYLCLLLMAMGEGKRLFPQRLDRTGLLTHLNGMLDQLSDVDSFYQSVGGLVGYSITVVRLLAGKFHRPDLTIHSPPMFDITEPTEEVDRAVAAAIKGLPQMAEIWPIGGAGDRLGLVDEVSGESLPAALLPFEGRTLLEGLIRDLQGREYLYAQLFGSQVITPIALMTSHEKGNDRRLRAILADNNWFGRPEESFFFFTQGRVPCLTEEGSWAVREPLEPITKPGGHGVLWRLLEESGGFDWLQSQGRKWAVVRQINNPVAGTDAGLLAFPGFGILENKEFGFAACPRAVGSAEGMDVLFEREVDGERVCGITNIEYTDFAAYGVEDVLSEPGSDYSKFPSNTNILFCDLERVRKRAQEALFPGMLINMKKTTRCYDGDGQYRDLRFGRLETTMQNLADSIWAPKGGPLPTYVTFGRREKTISVTKNSYLQGGKLSETPEGCYIDRQRNWRELLEQCGFEVGEGVDFYFHPALGPLYTVIAQKLRGGTLDASSELEIEIPQVDIEGLKVSGSLRILGDQRGRCCLSDVVIDNVGIDRVDQRWSRKIRRKESFSVTFEGSGEFHAEGVTLNGDHQIVVAHGQRVVATQQGIHTEPLTRPSWRWNYSFDKKNGLSLRRDHFEQS